MFCYFRMHDIKSLNQKQVGKDVTNQTTSELLFIQNLNTNDRVQDCIYDVLYVNFL